MKLKKLKITNIASIAEAEIDFQSAPLSDSPTFLICGETGSGKSTILDAICLALYNKTPRLSNGNRTEENIYRDGSQEISIVSVNQLLKKGEKDGAIELLFEGADGTDYCAEWKCRVNRNGRLEDEVWTVTDSRGHTESGKGKKRDKLMADIIGLDYDQFCRTSMLAQGQFTQFLKSDTKDKSDILEKITGTEIYATIGARIHQKAKDAGDAFKTADREANSVDLLPDEVKESYIREVEAIDGQIAKNKAAEALLDTLVKAFESIEAAEKAAELSEKVLGKARATFAALTADIACRKLALVHLQEQADSISARVEGQKASAGMYASVQTIESHLQNVSRQRREQALQTEALKRDGEALDGAEKARGVLAGKKAGAEEAMLQKRQAVAEAAMDKESLDPDGVEKERRRIAAGLDLVGKASADYAAIQSKIENLSAYRADYGKADAELAEDRKSLKALEENAAAADADYREIKATYDIQAQVLDKAAVRVREWLRESGSDECPVCHSRITSLLTTEQEEDKLRPLKDLVDRKMGLKENADAALTKARTALATREEEHSRASGRIASGEAEIARMKGDFAVQYSPLGITGKEDNLDEVLEAIKAQLVTRRKANEDAITAVGVKQKAIDLAISERDAFQKDVYDPAVKELTECEKLITEIKGRLDSALKLKDAAGRSCKESMETLSGLITIPGWEKAWEENAAGFIGGIKSAAEAYANDVKCLEDTLKAIETQQKAIRDAGDVHDRILAVDGIFEPESVSPAEFAGNAILEWGALENRITTARGNIRAASESIGSSRSALDQAFGADDTLPRTRDELLIMKAETGRVTLEVSERLGQLKTMLEEDERKHEMLKEKIAARDRASRLNAQWKTLDDLFGGKDGFTFKKIAQSYIMQDILNHANAYLKKIAPRYELTAQPGSLVILVQDIEEGRVRSGNTLSGGEGFVISLALALGLSSLAENSISVDTIFIDEGFGTLSQEWLNSVMSALEKLNAASGKHVGIISHIEELQRRIPTVIEVRKKNATTSEIIVRG